MNLSRIEVRSFRNIERAVIDPGPEICVLYGANAQGKTNLLEAVYFLSNLQSFRTHRIRDLLQLSGASAHVEGKVKGPYGDTRLSVSVDALGRKPRVNGKTPTNTAAYLSELPTVVFSPLDLSLARGSRELRRRYLDRATFLSDPLHLDSLRAYNRALKQRNAVLRTGKGTLDVWDHQLAQYGAAVHDARRRTLLGLASIVADIQSHISGTGERVEMECLPHYEGEDSVAGDLMRKLQESRQRDRSLGYTVVGPHRDALRVTLNGLGLRQHASQGQLRTLALSMKLALLKWGQEMLEQAPLFLLDDPGSELDRMRLAFLGEFLDHWSGQVFITGTEVDSVPLPADADVRSYRITAGRAVPASS